MRLGSSRPPDADALTSVAAMIGGAGGPSGLPPDFATHARALWKHLDELAARPDEYQQFLAKAASDAGVAWNPAKPSPSEEAERRAEAVSKAASGTASESLPPSVISQLASITLQPAPSPTPSNPKPHSTNTCQLDEGRNPSTAAARPRLEGETRPPKAAMRVRNIDVPPCECDGCAGPKSLPEASQKRGLPSPGPSFDASLTDELLGAASGSSVFHLTDVSRKLRDNDLDSSEHQEKAGQRSRGHKALMYSDGSISVHRPGLAGSSEEIHEGDQLLPGLGHGSYERPGKKSHQDEGPLKAMPAAPTMSKGPSPCHGKEELIDHDGTMKSLDVCQARQPQSGRHITAAQENLGQRNGTRRGLARGFFPPPQRKVLIEEL